MPSTYVLHLHSVLAALCSYPLYHTLPQSLLCPKFGDAFTRHRTMPWQLHHQRPSDAVNSASLHAVRRAFNAFYNHRVCYSAKPASPLMQEAVHTVRACGRAIAFKPSEKPAWSQAAVLSRGMTKWCSPTLARCGWYKTPSTSDWHNVLHLLAKLEPSRRAPSWWTGNVAADSWIAGPEPRDFWKVLLLFSAVHPQLEERVADHCTPTAPQDYTNRHIPSTLESCSRFLASIRCCSNAVLAWLFTAQPRNSAHHRQHRTYISQAIILPS